MPDFRRLALMKHVGCRMEAEHIEKIDRLAQRYNLNRSLVIRALLEESLVRYELEHGKIGDKPMKKSLLAAQTIDFL